MLWRRGLAETRARYVNYEDVALGSIKAYYIIRCLVLHHLYTQYLQPGSKVVGILKLVCE